MADAPLAAAAPPHVQIIRALRYRNYRLFFSGQSVSLVGTWITRIATSWLVYRLTGSGLLLGIVSFCGQIPTLLLAPFAGVLVDRWDKHRILVVTQALSMLQSLALAVLTLGKVITVPEILALQAAQGLINAFDTPARQSFLVQMVEDRSDLPNAIALNSSMVNGSRILGPSIGGMVIAAVGEGWCFLLDAISYLAVIASLLAMRLPEVTRARPETRLLDELRDGFRYLRDFVPIRTALLLLALVGTLGVPYTVLMPVMASTVLHGGPHTLGFLMTATGLGALVGALYMASRPTAHGLGRLMVGATLLFGGALICFSLSHALWLSLLLLPIVGAGFMIETASTNTFIQTLVEERLRGRVMAFFTMAVFGSVPIGSLIAGVAADRIGAPKTIMLGGLAVMAAGIWFMSRLPALGAAAREVLRLGVRLGVRRGVRCWVLGVGCRGTARNRACGIDGAAAADLGRSRQVEFDDKFRGAGRVR